MTKPAYKRIMLKLSGQVLEGSKESGIDCKILKSLCKEIAELHKKTKVEIVIVIGGGNIWRYRDFKDSGIERVNSDYMGMMATIMNAVAISATFKNLGTDSEVWSSIKIPHIAKTYDRPSAIKDLEKGKIVICAGGTGNPFFTTDSAAALRALELNCDVVLKATKVNGVFDKDPEKHPNAKHFPEISYSEILEKNLQVMDLAAVSLCKEKPLPIIVFDLNQKGNIEKAILGEKIGSKVS